jgi:serine O-acetyltransferase
MDKFLNNMELITGTIEKLDVINKKSKIKTTDGEAMILNRKEVVKVIKDLQSFLFPDYYTHSEGSENVLSQTELLLNIYNRLAKVIKGACEFNGTDLVCSPEIICEKFIKKLPEVKTMLLKDIEALYEGDPAAKCREEVLICYPGFYAISIFRLAHELYNLRVPLIPRIMTEFAHEKTGIDIHAGATIGEYFFIDHGTGIVIGETTVIGNHVKIYQGVTLGALSPRKGQSLAGVKRHPTVRDNVTIYSGASILGGETVIGDGAIIGGNSFITESVEAGARVSVKKPELIIK